MRFGKRQNSQKGKEKVLSKWEKMNQQDRQRQNKRGKIFNGIKENREKTRESEKKRGEM